MERHSTRYPAMVPDQRHFNIDCHFTPASGPGVGCVVPSLLSNRKEAAVSVFDRYLSLWVALGIIGRRSFAACPRGPKEYTGCPHPLRTAARLEGADGTDWL